jgi:8-oxo-dGTP diphosphatase
MDGYFSLIAGHIDGDESVEVTMIREAKEEAVIDLTVSDLIPATVIHRKCPDTEYVDFFFAATTWAGEIKNGEPEKCDLLAWYQIDNLPENILPYVKEAITNYRDKIAFLVSGW